MEFDIRYRSYTFKHSYSATPDMDEERFKEHYHTSYEILYLVQGDADLLLQNTRYTIKPGSLLIIKPGEYHNILFRSDAPYERYVIRIDPMNLHRNMPRLLSHTKSVYNISGTPIEYEFRQMDQHIASVHPDVRVDACLGSLYLILSYLTSSDNLIQQADYVNEDFRQILDYIDSHIAEIHSTEDLTNGMHMSESTLYRFFSMQMKIPVMTYIRTQKCLLARNYLLEGVSPTEVSTRLGFTHYSSFYRDYQQIFHTSPGNNRE